MRPGTVIFDMDDVLCRYDLGKRLRALSRISGKTPRDIRAAIWDSGFEDDADAGSFPDADYYLAEFGRRIGHHLTRDEWIRARRAAMMPSAEVLDLARHIGQQARLAIYTNNGPLAKASMQELFPEVAEIFGERYFSFEFATKKPDPASFCRLMTRMAEEPEHCWFIDDKKSNVQGARLAGLRGHHFRSFAQLRDEAVTLGFSP